MDPNLFHLDWERTGEVLVAVALMAVLIERALSIVFEGKWFIQWREGREFNPNQNVEDIVKSQAEKAESKPKKAPVKEAVALIVAVIACAHWEVDAMSMIFLKAHVSWVGFIITGAIVAGGSKGSLKLFRDVMGIMSWREEQRQMIKNFQREKTKKAVNDIHSGGGGQ